MSKFFREVLEYVVGTEDNFSFNARALNSILAVMTVAAFMAFAFNATLLFSGYLVGFTFLLFISLSFQYYLVRFKGKFETIRDIFPYLNVAFFSILWFFDSGSIGSLSFIIFATMVANILVMRRSKARPVVVINILLPIVLLLVEYFFPNLIHVYSSRTERFLDLGFTYFVVGILFAVFLIKYKNMHLNLRDALIVQRNRNIEQSANLEGINIALLEKQAELGQAYYKMEQNIFVASLIQKAFLKSEDDLKKIFSDAFIILKPKAIISGDFYWLAKIDEIVYLIAADGTGHGVAASLITVMGNEILNELIISKKYTCPAEILNELQKKLVHTLTSAHNKPTDYHGMDIGVLCLDTKTKLVQFAGAKNNLILVRDRKIEVFKGARFGIGLWQAEMENPIPLHKFEYLPNDRFYLYSDGYYSQFGGKYNKRFRQAELLHELLHSSLLPFQIQKDYLQLIFENWKGTNEQNDDIMILGVKV